MCILDLIKVLMCKFHYDYIKNKYGSNSRLLFTDTDSLMYEMKTEDVCEGKEMFDFSNYSHKSKHYNDSNKLLVGKMKDQKRRFTIKEFVRLKPKICSFLVDNNNEPDKVNDVNKISVARISHSKYKIYLLNMRYLGKFNE